MISLTGDVAYPPVVPAETLRKNPGTVDLWYYEYRGVPAGALMECQRSWLNALELERLNAYRHEDARIQYLATRFLVRSVLSKYIPRPPADWTFRIGDHGKPAVEGLPPESELYFNLSNAYGLVVCAVSAAHSGVGVDIENTFRNINALEIARSCFAPAEVEDIEQTADSLRNRRFLAYWVLKESHAKAVGLGLALGLNQVAFRFESSGVRATFADAHLGSPERWQFRVHSINPHHLLGLSLQTNGAPMSLRVQQLT